MSSAESFIHQMDELSPQETTEPFSEGLQLLQETIIIEGSARVHRSNVDYTLEVPESLEVEAIGYISPGFGGIKLSSDPLRKELAQAGMAAVSLTPGRNGHTRTSDLLRAQHLHSDTLDAIGKDIGEHLFRIKKAVPNGAALDPYHKILIAHSMGGLSAMEHAEAEPGQVEMVVNLAAAGYSKMTLMGLAKSVRRGGPAGVRHEVIPFARQQSRENAKKLLKDVVVYYGGNPLRTGGEVLSILESDLGPRALTLTGKHGTRFAYYAMQHDCLVPPDQSIEDFVDYYDEIENSGHLAPQVKPRLVTNKVLDFVHNRYLEQNTQIPA